MCGSRTKCCLLYRNKVNVCITLLLCVLPRCWTCFSMSWILMYKEIIIYECCDWMACCFNYDMLVWCAWCVMIFIYVCGGLHNYIIICILNWFILRWLNVSKLLGVPCIWYTYLLFLAFPVNSSLSISVFVHFWCHPLTGVCCKL